MKVGPLVWLAMSPMALMPSESKLSKVSYIKAVQLENISILIAKSVPDDKR